VTGSDTSTTGKFKIRQMAGMRKSILTVLSQAQSLSNSVRLQRDEVEGQLLTDEVLQEDSPLSAKGLSKLGNSLRLRKSLRRTPSVPRRAVLCPDQKIPLPPIAAEKLQRPASSFSMSRNGLLVIPKKEVRM
jgi:hypothetical protein